MRWVLPATLGLIALLFVGVFDNGFVNWDDGIYIVRNPMVLDPGAFSLGERLSTPALGYALPLPVWIYGWLWRLDQGPAAFHGFSLAVHVLNAGLMYTLLRRNGATEWVAAAGTLAFGVHPLCVEPVAWATGLKDLLMATGLLAAMLAFTRPLAAVPGSLVAFASKPASILAALPLAALTWVQRDRDTHKGSVAVTLVVLLMGAGLGAFTALQETPMKRTTADEGFTFTRLFGALGLQVEHAVAPGTLSPRYPFDLVGPVEVALGVAAAAAVVWLAARWIRRRDPRLPWLALGVAAYIPVSNLHPLERFTADSYVYVPWLATMGCAALSWPALMEKLDGAPRRTLRLMQGFVALVLLGWSAITFGQVEVWTDSLTLWQEDYLSSPDDPDTIYRYGDALGRSGRVDEELEIYLEHEETLKNADRIPIVLVLHYERSGDISEATRWYRRALSSEVAQDEAMYRYYVEFVAADPARHTAELDAALRYALPQYVTRRGTGSLESAQIENLAGLAKRLNLPQVHQALRGAPNASP